MLGKIRLNKFRWLSLPFRINKNSTSQIKSNQVKSNQIKSNQIKSNEVKSNEVKSSHRYELWQTGACRWSICRRAWGPKVCLGNPSLSRICQIQYWSFGRLVGIHIDYLLLVCSIQLGHPFLVLGVSWCILGSLC